jgi:hypothetical protein
MEIMLRADSFRLTSTGLFAALGRALRGAWKVTPIESRIGQSESLGSKEHLSTRILTPHTSLHLLSPPGHHHHQHNSEERERDISASATLKHYTPHHHNGWVSDRPTFQIREEANIFSKQMLWVHSELIELISRRHESVFRSDRYRHLSC